MKRVQLAPYPLQTLPCQAPPCRA